MQSLWNGLNALWPPLLLLLAVNGAPILARKLLGERLSRSLDGGRCFVDGLPLLGESKSWRGLIAALFSAIALAPILGLSWWLGAQFAALSMLGDLLASFTKRRLGIVPRGRAPGLDQVPESLLPLWLLHDALGLGALQVGALVLLFIIVEMLLSPLLFRWHIRLRPY